MPNSYSNEKMRRSHAASMVKWHHVCLPSSSLGFDSRSSHFFFAFSRLPSRATRVLTEVSAQFERFEDVKLFDG